MAFFFTFAIECHQEQDAVRICENLRPCVVHVEGRQVPLADVDVVPKDGFWYVYAMPVGPGYSQYGYGEGMNEPSVIRAIIESLYEVIASEAGIRRALCGYEAQDLLNDCTDLSVLDRHDYPNLVYDRSFGRHGPNSVEFGEFYYRNPAD